jgi:Holliday junction resolvase RusA-like endonuclease
MLPNDYPPDLGLITFQVNVAPVSAQASGKRKAPVLSALRKILTGVRYLLSGDVKLGIEWHVSRNVRYEGDSSADVDNIIKLPLDGLTGPGGIMIDDCQVQELTCSWTHLYHGSEHVIIELRYTPDEYLLKQGLLFLHVGNGLYFPTWDDVPELALERAERIVERFSEFRQQVASGTPETRARLLLPMQRLFHKSRVREFQLFSIDELRQRFGPPPSHDPEVHA